MKKKKVKYNLWSPLIVSSGSPMPWILSSYFVSPALWQTKVRVTIKTPRAKRSKKFVGTVAELRSALNDGSFVKKMK